MRRSLVLTQEGARHSFRASLPAAVKLRRRPRLRSPEIDAPALQRSLSDTRGVVSTYFAATLAVLVFIM
jgi:hypothetical protein